MEIINEKIIVMPMKLVAVKVKNHRSIKDSYIRFKDGLNIIVGPSASGKTIAIDIIRSLYLKEAKGLPEYMRMLSSGQATKFVFLGLLGIMKSGCIIIDDLFGSIDDIGKKEIIDALVKSGNQVVMAALDNPEIRKLDANFIEVKQFMGGSIIRED